jgi:hypothetical protein
VGRNAIVSPPITRHLPSAVDEEVGEGRYMSYFCRTRSVKGLVSLSGLLTNQYINSRLYEIVEIVSELQKLHGTFLHWDWILSMGPIQSDPSRAMQAQMHGRRTERVVKKLPYQQGRGGSSCQHVVVGAVRSASALKKKAVVWVGRHLDKDL